MTDSDKREASRQFYQKWVGKGKEDENDRSYWLDILQRIMGADDATDRVEFQKKVIVDGHTKRIDAYKLMRWNNYERFAPVWME